MITKPTMADLVPPGGRGGSRIEHFTVSREDAERHNTYAAIRGDREARIDPGRYARLYVNGALMMSDTPFEWRTNREAIEQAHGDVLIAGLGLGMVLHPILGKPEVRSVTVVERSADVIALVHPYAGAWPGGEKLRVLHDDILMWRPPRGDRWDVIYFDIWSNVCADDDAERHTLKRRFRSRLRPGGWIRSWAPTGRRR